MEKAAQRREDLPRLLSYKELQKQFGMSHQMAYRLLNSGDMPTVHIGTRLFMHRDRFLEWLDAQAAGKQDAAQSHG